MQRSEQQLPSVSLETFHEPPYSVHESEVNEENKALPTHGNSALGGFGGKTRNNSAPFFFSFFPFLAMHFCVGPLRARETTYS